MRVPGNGVLFLAEKNAVARILTTSGGAQGRAVGGVRLRSGYALSTADPTGHLPCRAPANLAVALQHSICDAVEREAIEARRPPGFAELPC